MAIDWTFWPSDPTFNQDGYWDWRSPWIQPSRPSTIRWAAAQTVAPTLEPLTVTGAKLHLRVDTSDDDDLIANLIQAAREYVEMRTQLALLTQTWVLQTDRFPRDGTVELWPQPGIPLGAFLLPRNPVQSVSSVIWYDVNGSPTTVSPSTYTVDLNSRPARIVPTSTSSWPSTSSPGLAQMAGVKVTFVAGYATQQLIPANLKAAIYLILGHWYNNREEVLSGTRLVAIQLPVAADTLIGYHTPAMVG